MDASCGESNEVNEGLVFTPQPNDGQSVDLSKSKKLDPSAVFVTYDGKHFFRFYTSKFILSF